jgi:uncharacterized protein with PIN domain
MGLKTHLVKGKTVVEKLADFAFHFNIELEINYDKMLCTECNSTLLPIQKQEIQKKIPISTYNYYNNFITCFKCNKIYWQGSHWKKINHNLQQAKKLLTSKKQTKILNN